MMLTNRLFLLLATLLIGLPSVHSQNTSYTHINQIDLSKPDTNTVNAINNLALKNKSIDLKLSGKYALQAANLAKQINYIKGMAYGLYHLGTYYWRADKFDSALFTCHYALYLFDSLNIIDGKILCHNRIAITHMYNADFEKSINHYYKALAIAEATHNTTHLGMIYHNIAATYSNLNDFNKALEFINKALVYKANIDNPISTGVSLFNKGRYYLKLDSIDKALELCRKSLAHNIPISNNFSIAGTYLTLGGIYDNKQKFDSAFFYYNLALKIARKYGNKRQIGFTNYYFGKHYLLRENYNKAIKHAKIAVAIADSNNYLSHAIYAKEVLYKAYNGLGNTNKAFQYLNEVYWLKENLNKQTSLRRLALKERELQHRLDQQQLSYNQHIELSEQKNIRNYFIFAFSFAFIVLVLITYILIQKTKANRWLVMANKTRDKMIKVISHDFRSPLISISSAMQLIPNLLDKKDYNTIVEFSNENEKSVSKVLHLIDNLINWTLSQNNSIPYNPTILNLSEIVDQVFEIYLSMAKGKEVELINEVASNVRIYGDTDLLHTVFRNLLNNAIKFTQKNGTVTILANKKEHLAEICITDTGIGIEERTRKNLFIHQQENKQGTEGETGNGIGLFFTKEFVEKNKGKIWLKSKIGKGTKVYFTIPLG